MRLRVKGPSVVGDIPPPPRFLEHVVPIIQLPDQFVPLVVGSLRNLRHERTRLIARAIRLDLISSLLECEVRPARNGGTTDTADCEKIVSRFHLPSKSGSRLNPPNAH